MSKSAAQLAVEGSGKQGCPKASMGVEMTLFKKLERLLAPSRQWQRKSKQQENVGYDAMIITVKNNSLIITVVYPHHHHTVSYDNN